MKLKTKFSVWGIGSSFLILIVSGVSWFSVNKLLYSTERVTHTYDVIMQAEKVQQTIELLEYEQELFLIFHDSKMLDLYKETSRGIDDEINKLVDYVWTPSQKEKLKEIQVMLNEWKTKSGKEIFGNSSADREELTKGIMDRLVSMDPVLVKAKTSLKSFRMPKKYLCSAGKLQWLTWFQIS